MAVPAQETVVKVEGCEEGLGVVLGTRQVLTCGVVDDVGILCG